MITRVHKKSIPKDINSKFLNGLVDWRGFSLGRKRRYPIFHQVQKFLGSTLYHGESQDIFSVVRLSGILSDTLLDRTKKRAERALRDTKNSPVPLEIYRDTVMDVLEEWELEDLTHIDLLTSEWIDPAKIQQMLKELRDEWREKGDLMNFRTRLNLTYKTALAFIQFLGIRVTEEQKQRIFLSENDFLKHLSSLQPSSWEKGSAYKAVIECAIIRAMDIVYDVSTHKRLHEIDQESELILETIKHIPGLIIQEIWNNTLHIKYSPPKNSPFNIPFSGKIYIRKKYFLKILLKMTSNRKYTDIDLMNDLLGFRFELSGNKYESQWAMECAVGLFSQYLFENKGIYSQKWELVDIKSLTKTFGMRTGEFGKTKDGTDDALLLGDIIGTVRSQTMLSKLWLDKRETGPVEMQFMYQHGMDGDFFTSSPVYDFKKFLSASARILKGFDIKNLKFFIRYILQIEDEEIEKNILKDLIASKKTKKGNVSKRHDWIERQWRWNAGFLIPLVTSKWGIRFHTADTFTPEYYVVYGAYYPTPAIMDFEYLWAMYKRANVSKQLKEFRALGLKKTYERLWI